MKTYNKQVPKLTHFHTFDLLNPIQYVVKLTWRPNA